MKIALVAPTTIPARRANTVQVMKMAQALVSIGHQVHVLTPFDPEQEGKTSPAWEVLAEQYGLLSQFPLERLPAQSRLRRYDYGLQAVRWMRREKCDLLYTRLLQSAALGSQMGMPTLLEMHDLPGSMSGRLLFRLFLNGRGARRLAVITHSLAQDLVKVLSAPLPGNPDQASFTVIAPDGVDLGRFTGLPGPREARSLLPGLVLPVESYTAGYTGHLYPGRGVELLFELAHRLPVVNFLLVGGDPLDVERLQKRTQELGLINVQLTGFIPNSILPLYQAACDVLLMPYGIKVSASSGGDISRYLSPMKLFEYMACERPIISSDLTPLREILNDGNSVLLPSDQVEAWTAALEHLRSEPETGLQIAHQARQDVTRYTWEARARLLLAGI